MTKTDEFIKFLSETLARERMYDESEKSVDDNDKQNSVICTRTTTNLDLDSSKHFSTQNVL